MLSVLVQGRGGQRPSRKTKEKPNTSMGFLAGTRSGDVELFIRLFISLITCYNMHVIKHLTVSSGLQAFLLQFSNILSF